ncbi:MAG: DUF2863 family protein [Ottowia sp.]|nr:DUF2863 family protein [Ottowia sp.]
MDATQTKKPKRLSVEAKRLVGDTLAWSASSSHVERCYWENKVSTSLARVLKNKKQSTIDSSLDHLSKHNLDGYHQLGELAEAISESARVDMGESSWDVLLLAAPVLAQTYYAIPSGVLKADAINTLSTYLQMDVLSQQARITMAPFLYSMDQLPRNHVDTYRLLHQLIPHTLAQNTNELDLRPVGQTVPALADPRYLLAAIAVPAGTAMFRWQESGEGFFNREHCLTQWRQHAQDTVAHFLAGSEFELLLPQGFFFSCCEADKEIRPLSLRAAINYLTRSLAILPAELTAVIGAFGTNSVDEYRIGFVRNGEKQVVYGVIWTLYEEEGSEPLALKPDTSTLDAICDILRAAGVTEIFRHTPLHEPDYCEDCDAPLYLDHAGELVHANLPEHVPLQQPLFH